MPATYINLLEQNAFETSFVSKLIRWALTYGRYIIISTEIVVLLAFIYRFKLDRQITDLNQLIEQKSKIVANNLDFEEQFRNLQTRVEHIDTLTTNIDVSYKLIEHLEEITPKGVHFSSLTISSQSVLIDATAKTTSDLALFLTSLKSSPYLSQINVTTLNKKVAEEGEAVFRIEAGIKL